MWARSCIFIKLVRHTRWNSSRLPAEPWRWQPLRRPICVPSASGTSAMCGNCRRPDRQTESRRRFMADKIKVWFDAEADFLEVRFSDAAGYEKETKHDAVMERVDAAGHVIGFRSEERRVGKERRS